MDDALDDRARARVIVLIVLTAKKGSTATDRSDARRDASDESCRMSLLERLRGLVKRFGGLAATDGVDLDREPGEVHAVIGPNGAGKTTLINQLSGEIRPDAGSIRFDGRDDHARAGLSPRADGARPLVPDHVGVSRVQRARQRDARRAGARGPQLPLLASARRRARARRARARALDGGGAGSDRPTSPWQRSRTASAGSSRSR